MKELDRLHAERWRILGYCVMPDHVHLLVLNIENSLLDFMRLFKGRLVRRLRGHVAGTVWQRSSHDHLLRRNEDINGTLRYLLENPVRAGLVDKWTQYPWCGSLQWPKIDPEFFAVNSANVLWGEIFAL
jgi:REP element-mobilizing transposase RayT